MVNRVLLVGTETRAPQERFVNQKKVIALSVETTRQWEDKTFREFHSVLAYGKTADIAAGLEQGDLVMVEGSLQSRSWTEDNGTKRRGTDVSALHISKIISTNARQPVAATAGEEDW